MGSPSRAVCRVRALRLALRRFEPKYARKSNKALRSASLSVCASVCVPVCVRGLTSCFYTLSSGLSACGEAAYEEGRMPELSRVASTESGRRGKIGQRERSNALRHASDIHLVYVSLSLTLSLALFVARSINFIALLFFFMRCPSSYESGSSSPQLPLDCRVPHASCLVRPLWHVSICCSFRWRSVCCFYVYA